MKAVVRGKITEFPLLKSELYSLVTVDDKEIRKTKILLTP